MTQVAKDVFTQIQFEYKGQTGKGDLIIPQSGRMGFVVAQKKLCDISLASMKSHRTKDDESFLAQSAVATILFATTFDREIYQSFFKRMHKTSQIDSLFVRRLDSPQGMINNAMSTLTKIMERYEQIIVNDKDNTEDNIRDMIAIGVLSAQVIKQILTEYPDVLDNILTMWAYHTVFEFGIAESVSLETFFKRFPDRSGNLIQLHQQYIEKWKMILPDFDLFVNEKLMSLNLNN